MPRSMMRAMVHLVTAACLLASLPAGGAPVVPGSPQKPIVSPATAAPRSAVPVAPTAAPVAPTPPPSPAVPVTPTPSPSPGDLSAAHTCTLTAAIEQALRANPGLRVAERQQQEAWWAYKVGVSLPSAEVSLNYVGGNNPSATSIGTSQDYNLSVTQSFGSIRQIALTGKSAYQGWLIARATTRQTRISLVAQVKDAFYGVLVAQSQLDVAKENLTLANRVLDLARQRFEAGAGPRMDLLNAQIQQASAQQSFIQAELALKQARNALLPLLGYREQETVAVEGDTALPALQLVYASLEETAQKLNPQVEIAATTLAQSETQVKLARSQALPAPSLTYTYDLRTTPLYWIGASITVPLDWGQIRYGVRQQQATVEEKQHALDSARLSVSSSVKTAYDNYQAALLGIETFRTTVLNPSEELMTMIQTGYKEGALPFLQVLNAEQTLRQARTQFYTLLLSGHQALDALEAAVGRDFQGETKP